MSGLWLCLAAGFVAAVAAPWLHRPGRSGTGWLLATLPLGVTGYLATKMPAVAAGDEIREAVAWLPALGVEAALRLDALGLFFALLVSVVGASIFVYADRYMRDHVHAGRFYAYMLLFFASMLGLVLADDGVALYVFFEGTSVASFLLIGFESEQAGARRAARQALLVTSAGGLALLAAVLLLGEVAGTYRISALLEEGSRIRQSALHAPIALLVLAAAFSKSAQFPFSFWLPDAMQAPTPVSAYLHSAAMVKAGIYLLARMSPALAGTELWTGTVTAIGAFTMVAASWVALRQTDLKRVLAYSTLMALGQLTLLLGIGGAAAVGACLAFLLAHALYKAALFMVAGALEHATGTREVTALGSLGPALPGLCTAGLLAGASMAGLPPSLGFIAKEEALLSARTQPFLPELWLASLLAASAALAAAAGLAAVRPFFGRRGAAPETLHRPDAGLWLPPLVLAVLGVALALAPHGLDAWLLEPAVRSVVEHSTRADLALWHGLTPELGWTVGALGVGALTYAAWDRIRSGPLLRILGTLLAGVPERACALAGRAVVLAGTAQMHLLQSGLLRRYLGVAFGASFALIGYTALRHGAVGAPLGFEQARPHEWVIAGLVVAAALAVIVVRPRLGAILALSVAGYGTALIYLIAGAPDVSMTQALIETLTIILIVLVYIDLPEVPADPPGRAVRWQSAAIALAGGAAISGLMFAVLSVPLEAEVSAYFEAHAEPAAHGRNVVNTILVDFRSFDTLGEITVLGVAALGVRALMAARRDAGSGPAGRQGS